MMNPYGERALLRGGSETMPSLDYNFALPAQPDDACGFRSRSDLRSDPSVHVWG